MDMWGDYSGDESASDSWASSEEPDQQVTRGPPAPTSWPCVVGDEVGRATAIVRASGPYYVVVVPFRGAAPPVSAEVAAHRVVFYLDPHGWISTTPRVG